MKRSGSTKFPQSAQLFKFCYKIMSQNEGRKINDQDIGSILEYNPSDCSHWKRGEKHVKSVFALAKLAEHLKVEIGIIHDLASGAVDLEEACYELNETKLYNTIYTQMAEHGDINWAQVQSRIENFANALLKQSDFKAAPLYLPEVMRFFAFVQTQPAEMIERLSRILRVKPNQYLIQYKKGDMRAQTRLSMTKDLGRLILDAERERFPELGARDERTLAFELMVFCASVLIPKQTLIQEIAKFDTRMNAVQELSNVFWAPKSLVSWQVKQVIKNPLVAFAVQNTLLTSQENIIVQ